MYPLRRLTTTLKDNVEVFLEVQKEDLLAIQHRGRLGTPVYFFLLEGDC
jgi:hypothetical protein